MNNEKNSKIPFFNRVEIDLANDYKKMWFSNFAVKFFSISLKILITTVFLYILTFFLYKKIIFI